MATVNCIRRRRFCGASLPIFRFFPAFGVWFSANHGSLLGSWRYVFTILFIVSFLFCLLSVWIVIVFVFLPSQFRSVFCCLFSFPLHVFSVRSVICLVFVHCFIPVVMHRPLDLLCRIIFACRCISIVDCTSASGGDEHQPESGSPLRCVQ